MSNPKKPTLTVVPNAGGSAPCLSEACKHPVSKAGFCTEHFGWFKEGLITIQGKKVPDFDKKWVAHEFREQKKAA